MQKEYEQAAFGAGCFWGVEELFRTTPGVIDTKVGYMGGNLPNPTYEEVCEGETGHAETVLVTYDPEQVSYDALLAIFWQNHDPTSLNQQGPDRGTQYRSVIFYYTPEQEKAAHVSRKKLHDAGTYRRPIVTEIIAAPQFYPAEEYHQHYLAKRGLGTCHI